jgi:hypothetical protein
LTVGGIVAGVETRSVMGCIRADLSLYPTRKPSEKKTPQTATPAKKTRIRCRVESPLSSRRACIFISIANSGKEIQNSNGKRQLARRGRENHLKFAICLLPFDLLVCL